MLYSDFKTMITMVSTKIGLKKVELEIEDQDKPGKKQEVEEIREKIEETQRMFDLEQASRIVQSEKIQLEMQEKLMEIQELMGKVLRSMVNKKQAKKSEDSQLDESSSNFKMSHKNETSDSSNFSSIPTSIQKKTEIAYVNEQEEKNETSTVMVKQTHDDQMRTSQGSSNLSQSIMHVGGQLNVSQLAQSAPEPEHYDENDQSENEEESD